ncbi:MAG: hypothetical protein AB7G13_07800 [Lautropia sp.]
MPTTLDSSTTTSAHHSFDRLAVTTTEDRDDPRFHHRNGVYYPVGYALLAFPDAAALARAVELALTGGIADADMTVLQAAQVKQITDRSQHDAGLLARIVSAELKQLTVLEQLAESGHTFLLVRHRDEIRPTLDRISAGGASKGLLYHRLAVEELPVAKETIPGPSPFGMNEVVRTQHSDASVIDDHDEQLRAAEAAERSGRPRA